MNHPLASELELPQDRIFMRAALAFGRRHLGETADNPAVGALVVRDGMIVGRGATARGGRPHAEILALENAGERAQGGVLYVTLEPCCHHGKTPPCVDRIISAKIARVVYAMEDPDPRVAGMGHARLLAANIPVTAKVCIAEALLAHIGHVRRIQEGRPSITFRISETADGFCAGGEYDPRLMITGLVADRRTHILRALHDAIMVGIGTILGDDPLLTVRLPGVARKPLRIILDTHLNISPHTRLVATAQEWPTLVLTAQEEKGERAQALLAAGIMVETVKKTEEGHIHLLAALQALARRGLSRIYSEGGPTIGSHLITQRLADEVILLRAPRPLGIEGIPSLTQAARTDLANPAHWQMVEQKYIGADRMRRYVRTELIS